MLLEALLVAILTPLLPAAFVAGQLLVGGNRQYTIDDYYNESVSERRTKVANAQSKDRLDELIVRMDCGKMELWDREVDSFWGMRARRSRTVH